MNDFLQQRNLTKQIDDMHAKVDTNTYSLRDYGKVKSVFYAREDVPERFKNRLVYYAVFEGDKLVWDSINHEKTN